MPRYPDVSTTTQSLSSRVFSGLAKQAAARRKSEKVLHSLSVGDTYQEPLEVARAENQRVADRPGLHRYAPPRGEPELVEAIQRRLQRRGADVSARNLQVVSGATSGLSVVVNALFAPGDEVLLPSPFWPLIRGIIASRGAVPVQVPLFTQLAATADVDIDAHLEAAVTKKTVAIYVNSPHNPTGVILSPTQVESLIDVAVRHDLWVITDEAYEDFYYTGEAPTPIWQNPRLEGRVIASHTLSKSYGIAGCRVGYLHGPETAMRAIRGVQTFATYCAARPLQFGAAKALDTGDTWLASRRAEFGRAAQQAAKALGVPTPAGGTFLFVNATRYIRDGETDVLPFLGRCLDVGVQLTPGAACGSAFGQYFRLCFSGVPPADLEDALARLAPLIQ